MEYELKKGTLPPLERKTAGCILHGDHSEEIYRGFRDDRAKGSRWCSVG